MPPETPTGASWMWASLMTVVSGQFAIVALKSAVAAVIGAVALARVTLS
jgi:hypothetical protein